MTSPFEVRRSRLHAALYFCGALGLFAFTLAYAWSTYLAGSGLIPALMLAALMGFYAVQTGQQFMDRSPLIVVGRDGLALPAAAAQPIPWGRIWRLQATHGLTGARLDVMVDVETFNGLKLGSRWMGDHFVKARHLINGFSVLTAGLDRSARDIEQAIKRHWPPPEQTPEVDEPATA